MARTTNWSFEGSWPAPRAIVLTLSNICCIPATGMVTGFQPSAGPGDITAFATDQLQSL